MQTLNQIEQPERAEAISLVPAKFIARPLSCTARYVHQLEDEGKIPGHRFGRACRRYNPHAVFVALGIDPAEARQLVAKVEADVANSNRRTAK